MQTEIKATFTRDRINLGPIPDWVQIGFAFTRDLLEPVRYGPLTRYDVGPLEERSKYGPGPVQVSCKQARPIPLWMRFAFHAQQPKCTCSSKFLWWPDLSINTLWPKLTCFSNLFLNVLTFWRAFVFNNKMPFYKHCSNFRDLVNYPSDVNGLAVWNTFGPLSCQRLGTDPIRSRSGPVPNLSGPKFIRSHVNGA